ncbi:MAG: hypothetical protein JOZ81_14505 [Chloroflexi bacterium]|nr:hypothetical protein [Chloroflexota bacterium]
MSAAIFARRRAADPYEPGNAHRPGNVTALKGVIFQSDGSSTIGRLFIRPFETLDRAISGILPQPGEPSLAMHAGLHVEIDNNREYVVEQLVGSWYMDFRNGLNWTPIEDFRKRDRGGWDVTLPGPAFRGVTDQVVEQTTQRLNMIEGQPFMGEDCTAFIERAFGRRRVFADSPVLRLLRIAARVGDPALPLLRPEASLDDRAAGLLAFERIKTLPDADADPSSVNVSLWLGRAAPTAALGALIGYSLGSRRSTPASRTARKFFR